MVGAPGRVGTWRPARQACYRTLFTPSCTILMSTRLDSDRLTTMTTLTYP